MSGAGVRLLGLRGLLADVRPVLATAAVVALSAGVVAAAPPLLAQAREDALRREAAAAPFRERDVEIVQATRLPAARLAETAAARLLLLPPLLAARTGRSELLVDSPAYQVAAPERPGLERFLTLRVQPSLAGHARVTEGRLPRAARGEVEVALSPETAASLQVAVGDVLRLEPVFDQALLLFVPFSERRRLAVRVVGLLEPDADDPYWFGDTRVAEPLVLDQESARIVRALAVTGDEGYAALLAASARMPLTFRWRYRVEPALLRPADVGPLEQDVRRVEARFGVVSETGTAVPEARTGLTRVLDRYRAQERSAATIGAFAGAGFLALTIAAIVAAALAGGRAHRQALRLARDRGAGTAELAVPVVGAAAAVSLPAASLGFGAAALAVGEAGAWSLAAAAAIGLIATAALALALWPARAADPEAAEGDTGAPGRRRATIESVVLALALLGVVSVQTGTPNGAFDPVAALTPLLVIAAVGIVLLRLLPLVVARVAGRVSRNSGLVASLALRRVERSGRPAGLVLAVSLLATGVAGFAALAAPASGSPLLERTREALGLAALLGAAYAAAAIVSIVIVVLRERSTEESHLAVLGLSGRARAVLGLAELVPAALAGVGGGVVAGAAAALAIRPVLDAGTFSWSGAGGLALAAVALPASCALAVAAAGRRRGSTA